MLADPLLVRRIEAYLQGRAVPLFTHARIEVAPHALVVAAVALSGEDATIHGVSVGFPEQESRWRFVVADPRQPDDHAALLGGLGTRLERYFAWCEARDFFPQLVLTSGPALGLLTNVADAYRFLERHPEAASCAVRLHYFAERAQVATQQSVVVMTEVLGAHWVTPMQPAQQKHLGALLACIELPPGAPAAELAERVRAAELEPMGVATRPEFDNELLLPLIDDYHRLRAHGAGEAVLAGAVGRIEGELMPVVDRMYDAIQWSLTILRAAGLPPVPDMPELQRVEARAFRDYRASVGRGVCFPLRDGPKRAAFRLHQLEEAESNLEAIVDLGDDFGRVRGVCLGQTLIGVAENHRVRSRDTRRGRDHTFELVSDQRSLGLREGDELRWADDTRLVVVVRDYRLEGARLRATLAVTAGMNRPGVPSAGTHMTFVRSVPDWDRGARQRRQMRDRLAEMPWTHVPGAEAPAQAYRTTLGGLAPADPLQDLEAFR